MKHIEVDWGLPLFVSNGKSLAVPNGFPPGLSSSAYVKVEDENSCIRVIGTTFGGEYHIYKDFDLIAKVNCCGLLLWFEGAEVKRGTAPEINDYLYHTKVGLFTIKNRTEFYLDNCKVAEVSMGEMLLPWLKRCVRKKRLVFPIVGLSVDYDERLLTLPQAITIFTMVVVL